MRNESLLEWVFRNDKKIRTAVYEMRNDPGVHGHGGRTISNPTQDKALKNVEELRSVLVPSGSKGATFRLSQPERWLKVIEMVREKFAGTIQGDLLQMYYDKNMNNREVIEELKLSRAWFFLLKNEILTYAEGVACGVGLHLEK